MNFTCTSIKAFYAWQEYGTNKLDSVLLVVQLVTNVSSFALFGWIVPNSRIKLFWQRSTPIYCFRWNIFLNNQLLFRNFCNTGILKISRRLLNSLNIFGVFLWLPNYFRKFYFSCHTPSPDLAIIREKRTLKFLVSKILAKRGIRKSLVFVNFCFASKIFGKIIRKR